MMYIMCAYCVMHIMPVSHRYIIHTALYALPLVRLPRKVPDTLLVCAYARCTRTPSKGGHL